MKSRKEIKATARETVAKQRIIAITTLLLLDLLQNQKQSVRIVI